MLLEYEKTVLEESSGQSCLLIMAGGLNIQKIILLTIESYLNDDGLTLLVAFDDMDKSMILMTNSPSLHDVGSLSRVKRKEKYSSGGVCIASSRVFVSDMIDGTMDIERIRCVMINNVELMTDTSLESFIVYIFRSRNSHGIVKGFSESPVPLSIGFSPLSGRMKSLRMDKVIFFPRFHREVEDSLNGDIELIEVRLRLPDKINQIQVILLEIIDNLLRMVLRGTDSLEIDHETVIFGSIHKIFKQMKISNCILVEDVYNMRILVFLLFSCDSATFYCYLKEMFRRQVELGRDSTWINLPISHTLMDRAKELVDSGLGRMRDDVVVEDMKIQDEESMDGDESDEEVIEMDGRGVGLISNISNESLRNYYCLNPKIKELVKILENMKGMRSLVLVSSKIVKDVFIRILIAFDLIDDILIVLTHHEFKYHEDEYENVIFIESCQDSVRRIEIYGITHSVRTYFLMYSDSLEEQRYLDEIRKEKASFEKLIEERSRLPLRLDYEDDVIDLDEYECVDKKYVIMIDSRELRSELPFYLFRAKNEIHVSTLAIGDYLLSPTTCIERKTIPDLISSLNTGRLYTQVSMMCYRYTNPFILLEFEGRPCLSDHYRHDQDTFRNSLIAKFTLLLTRFSRIRVIWSDSRLSSTRIMRDIQRQEREPLVVEGEVMDPVLHEILLSIPGITQFNLSKVRKRFRSLNDLVSSTQHRLESVLGSKDSVLVYEFFRCQE